MRLIYLFSLFFSSISLFSFAQTVDSILWQKPMRHSIDLSGNFGELRSNHFHGGVDFRTESVENKQVYAVQSGFVSRVSISPIGYGKALYITHPGGYTSVSAHLNGFSPKIEQRVAAIQRMNESFELDVSFLPHEIPVKSGEWVAVSGNTGSSGGPHLHFELRDELDHQLDFLDYIDREYVDTKPPQIFGISLYRMSDQGASFPPLFSSFFSVKKGELGYRLDRELRLWGKIAFGIRGLDYIDRSGFSFGVKCVELFVDSKLVFSSVMKSVPFKDTRLMNSFVDYAAWVENRHFYQKSYIEPGNMFPNTHGDRQGVIDISEARVYKMLYRLTDDVGNISELPFEVIGDPARSVTSNSPSASSQLMQYWLDNKIMRNDIWVQLPKGSLFTNLNFELSSRSVASYLTPVYSIDKPTVPLRSEILLSIALPKPFVAPLNKYVLAYINERGSVRYSPVDIREDRVESQIKILGDYAVTVDTLPPSLLPIRQNDWAKQGVIRFSVSDTQTRLKSYKGYIDDQFILFEYDAKSRQLFCILSKEQIARRRAHTLKMVVADACDNVTDRSYPFYY